MKEFCILMSIWMVALFLLTIPSCFIDKSNTSSKNEKEIKFNPTSKKGTKEYYLEYGDHKVAEGYYLEAIKMFTKAIEKDSTYLEAYVNRAESWAKEDSFNRAIKDYHKVVELKPSGESYFRLGNSYWKSASGRDSLACKYWAIGRDTYNYSRCWDAIRLHCKK